MQSAHLSQNQSFVIYDLETTGLRSGEDEFIQIAAIRYHQGQLLAEDSFFSFARPRKPISSFIESYTGISNHHVRKAPYPEEVLCQFSRWAGRSTLIAHNGQRFDSKFLEATCLRHGLSSYEVDSIDSIQLSKMLFGKTRGIGHSLDQLKNRLHLKETDLRRHDARGDVDILGRAVEAMRERLGLDLCLSGVPRHRTVLSMASGAPSHRLSNHAPPKPQHYPQAPPAPQHYDKAPPAPQHYGKAPPTPQHYPQAPPAPQHYGQMHLLNCPFCRALFLAEQVFVKTLIRCPTCSLAFYIAP
jgi:DNA polymerase-3 subunit epsilon